MDDFINVIKKDPQIRNKMNNMLHRYNKLSYNHQSKIGYYTLIQNVILKDLMNIMGITITDKTIDLEIKISRKEYLESRLLKVDEYMYNKGWVFT